MWLLVILYYIILFQIFFIPFQSFNAIICNNIRLTGDKKETVFFKIYEQNNSKINKNHLFKKKLLNTHLIPMYKPTFSNKLF